MSFSDISVSINGDAVATCVSNNTKQSIPYPQLLNLRLLCSDDKYFETISLETGTIFFERGYPTHLLYSAIQKAFNISRPDTLTPHFLTIQSQGHRSLPVIFKFLKMTSLKLHYPCRQYINLFIFRFVLVIVLGTIQNIYMLLLLLHLSLLPLC